jgi:hypothetical protein
MHTSTDFENTKNVSHTKVLRQVGLFKHNPQCIRFYLYRQNIILIFFLITDLMR